MPQSATPVDRFAVPASLPLEATFDGGRLTSDGGLPWLGKPRRRSGSAPPSRRACPSGGAARCGIVGNPGAPAGVPDRLRLRGPGRRRHPAPRPAAQAGLRPAAGDRGRPGQPADALAPGERGRPPGLLPAGRRAWASSTCASGSATGSRPTSCSTSTAPTTRPTATRKGPPTTATTGSTCIIRCCSSMATTDQLITAVLRPGNAHASAGSWPCSSGWCARMRARWPGVTIEVRHDSGCAVPAIYELLRGRRSATRSAWSPIPA